MANFYLINFRFAAQCNPVKNTSTESSFSEMFLRKDVLQICSKFTGEQPCRNVISLKLQSNSLFSYFMQNKRFTECQSGFIPGDSCVAQLLLITHEIYKSFDCNPPTDRRGIFLDISKAFDKVWHEGLIFKLKTYGIDGDLLKLLINYLEDRKQRVVLNGQTSSWNNILSGIPLKAPFWFLFYS